jgi:hypothetical protein
MRVSLREGGHLYQLGAGTQMVSAHDAKSLKLWRYLTTGVSALVIVQMTYPVVKNLMKVFLGTGYGEDESEWRSEDFPSAERTPLERLPLHVKWILAPFLFQTLAPILISGFFYTLRLGSALARDSVTEVTAVAKVTSPHDKEKWDRNVTLPMLKLDETMMDLSSGYGRGLLGIDVALWLFAVANICKAIDQVTYLEVAKFYECTHQDGELQGEPDPYCHRDFALISAVFYVCLSLLLTLDVAMTSPSCDEMMDVLNHVRIGNCEECHVRLFWLDSNFDSCSKNLQTTGKA